jgi:archaellum component FlaC
MDRKDIDLNQKIEEFRNSAKGIHEIVEFYEERITELQSFLGRAESSIAAAEERTKLAEEQAERANEKYKQAIELQKGQYVQLIRDLFEAPRNELERSIKEQTRRSRDELERSIKYQSRQSNIITVSIAAVSILLSILISIVSAGFPSGNNSKTLETLKDKTEGIERRAEKIMELVSNDDPKVKEIIGKVMRNNSEFNNYRTKNDLEYAYKVSLSYGNTNTKYTDYVRAMNLFGIQQSIIPSEEELRQWDTDFAGLCSNAINVLKQKNGTDKVQNEEEKKFRTYKSPTDATDYKDWGYHNDLTYAQLASSFQYLLETHQKQVSYNNQK